MHDVSRTGMFLALTQPFAIGTPVIVGLNVEGVKVSSSARVTHCLQDGTAVGRTPGIGIAFRQPLAPSFATAIETLIRRITAHKVQDTHVVVADGEPRMLERLSAALADAGFSVATASNGMEVFGACLSRKPDLMLIDRHTPVVDGMQLIQRFVSDDTLTNVPIAVMTKDPRDIETAFAAGAADVILKPFSLVELVARLRRMMQMPRRNEREILTGSLAAIGLGTVLTMLEHEKKTNRVVLSNGHAAWIDVVDGKVVDAGWSLDDRHPRAVVLEVLEWRNGTFKLIAPPPRRRTTSFAMPIMQLLLEQAKIRDEALRAITSRTATS